MSETLRVYSRDPYKRVRRKGGFWKTLLWLIVILFVIITGWVLWISKDSHQVEEFLPTSYNFRVFSPNIMQNSEMLVNSPIWKFLNEEPESNQIRKFLTGEGGIPVWVLKHLICDFLYFSAEDIKDTKTYLLIIKLSRLGCVLETLYSLFGEVEYDWAGGIGLYHSKALNICHTRKGRVVVLSPSREHVIKAVTKATNERNSLPVSLDGIDRYEDIVAYGDWRPSVSIKGVEISNLSFSLNLSQSEINFNANISLNYSDDAPWMALLSELTPGPIKEDTSDAIIYLAGYSNIPLKNWLNAIEPPIATLEVQPPSQTTTMEPKDLLKQMFRMFENDFYIRIDSFYFDEIIPFIPRFAIGGKIPPSEWDKVSETILNTPIMFLGGTQKFRAGKESGEYILSLLGSAQTDLNLSINDDSLIISNAPEMKQWASHILKEDLPVVQSNILLKAKPNKLAENITKALEPLLTSKIIQIKDERKFNDIMSKLNLLDTVALKVSFKNTLCKLTAHIKLFPSS